MKTNHFKHLMIARVSHISFVSSIIIIGLTIALSFFSCRDGDPTAIISGQRRAAHGLYNAFLQRMGI